MKKIEIVIPELEDLPDIEYKREWTDWEIGVLRKYFGRKPTEAIGKVLKRTTAAVQSKAMGLGLRKTEIQK